MMQLADKEAFIDDCSFAKVMAGPDMLPHLVVGYHIVEVKPAYLAEYLATALRRGRSGLTAGSK